jgi:hypothetical protein
MECVRHHFSWRCRSCILEAEKQMKILIKLNSFAARQTVSAALAEAGHSVRVVEKPHGVMERDYFLEVDSTQITIETKKAD